MSNNLRMFYIRLDSQLRNQLYNPLRANSDFKLHIFSLIYLLKSKL